MKLFKKISKPVLVALSIIGLGITAFVVYLLTKKSKNSIANPFLGNSNMEDMPMVGPTTLYELLEDVTVWDIGSDNQFSFTFPKGTLIYKPVEINQPQYVGTNFKIDKIFTDEEAKNVDFILVSKKFNLQRANLSVNRVADLHIKKSLVKLKSPQEIEQYELYLAHSKAESTNKIIYSNVDYVFSFKETFECEVTDFSPGDYQLNTKKTLTPNDTLEAKTFFRIPEIKLPTNQFIDVFPEAPDYEYYINLRIGNLLYKVPSSKLSSIREKK